MNKDEAIRVAKFQSQLNPDDIIQVYTQQEEISSYIVAKESFTNGGRPVGIAFNGTFIDTQVKNTFLERIPYKKGMTSEAILEAFKENLPGQSYIPQGESEQQFLSLLDVLLMSYYTWMEVKFNTRNFELVLGYHEEPIFDESNEIISVEYYVVILYNVYKIL